MSSKFTISEILEDHWDSFCEKYSGRIRPAVLSEVGKVISCGDSSKGFAMYTCPDCGKYIIVPFRCHSRFCNTCGVAYQKDRCEVISAKLLNCKHRHVVFTIAEELRIYFRKDRRLLSLLFQSAAQTFSAWLTNMNKSRKFKTGMVCGLHTFGRDLKWNPHIHMLVAEGALAIDGKWRNINFFPYTMLRKRWMTTLLSKMKHALDPELFDLHEFNRLVSKLYSDKSDGFYVHAPGTDLESTDAIVKYVTRYIGRPVMAQSRITGYDGTYVTYWYQRHEDDKVEYVTEHAFDFIKKLIIHIPEKGFNMLRYYGLYAEGPDAYPQLIRRISDSVRRHRKLFMSWRYQLDLSFGRDPLKCECGQTMELSGIYHPHSHPPPNMLQYAYLLKRGA